MASTSFIVGATYPGIANAATADIYTLDGHVVSTATATSAASCAGIPDAHGVVACFSSQGRLLNAQAAAVRSGQTPVGWGYLPTDVSQDVLASRIEAEPSGSTPPAKLGGGIISPMSAGDSCNGYTNIHIWTDANYQTNPGNIGPTGGWYNLSSTYSNHISSYWNSDYYTSWFADYTGGNGATYGPIGHCHWNDNLASATMSDGGTANDRFSSAYVGA